MKKLKILDLFSGIGGFSLGLERTGGFETIAFCEIEEFPRKILAKHWPNVPIAHDVRKLSYNRKTQQLFYKTRVIYVGRIDVVCGGYPCQPFSAAGDRKGTEDDRHLWPEIDRLLDEIRPDWFIGENVAGHISLGLDNVLSDLEKQEFTARAFIIPACAVDAKHRRDRVWIVAHSIGNRWRKKWARESSASSETLANTSGGRFSKSKKRENEQSGRAEIISTSEDVPHTNKFNDDNRGYGASQICGERPTSAGLSKSKSDVAYNDSGNGRASGENKVETRTANIFKPGSESRTRIPWPAEPAVGRVAHGIPNRVDRLKGLGNAVVPQIPEIIGGTILEAERQIR